MICFYHRGNADARAFAANGVRMGSNSHILQRKWQGLTSRARPLESGLRPRQWPRWTLAGREFGRVTLRLALRVGLMETT